MITEATIFRTSDGRSFESLDEAKLHENKADKKAVIQAWLDKVGLRSQPTESHMVYLDHLLIDLAATNLADLIKEGKV